MTRILSAQVKYGRTTVGTRKSSTGVYGKRISGSAPVNAVRTRRGRR